jgi:Domain of Unknown Function (DUF1259)
MKAYILAAGAYAGLSVLVALDPPAGYRDMECEAAAAASLRPAAADQQASDTMDWKAVDLAMGRAGKLQPGDVYKYNLPRSDLRISVGSVALKPALALGSWVAFKRKGSETLAMGDLVLTEDEIAPVMDKLQGMGVEQTALHNHLLHESPGVMYLHIHAHGDPVKIAQAVRAALALTKTPPSTPSGAEPTAALDLDTAAIANALGRSGQVNGGVYQVSVPRAESVHADGMEIPPSMGVATALNFQPTGGSKAAVTGDFVMTAPEVNPVVKALRGAGIEVTALHSHMLNEEPRLFFAHFWANDAAVKLARGLGTALQRMNVKKSTT